MLLKPALFLHIQKTAGTAVIDTARNYYGSMNMITHGQFLDHTPGDFARLPFVSGHFGFDFARELMPGRFSFTFLREPIERILSLYFFCRMRDPNQFVIYKLAQELSLEEFLQAGITGSNILIRIHIWNNQVWQLACGYGNPQKRKPLEFGEDELLDLALNHSQVFSHIGFTDTIDADSAVIFSALGIPVTPQLPKANVTDRKPSYTELPPNIQDTLKELTSLDRQLYDRLWAERLARDNADNEPPDESRVSQ